MSLDSQNKVSKDCNVSDSQDVKIKTDYIKLSSFLKFIGQAETGGMASNMIENGEVFVNGEACFMRGKKLKNGDVCRVNGKNYRVIQGDFEGSIV